jgi:hypothetical protein
MDSGMVYRGQKRQLRAGPKRPCVISFTCTNCDGKNWVAIPRPGVILAQPNVLCWQCGVMCGVRARPSSGIDEALSDPRLANH